MVHSSFRSGHSALLYFLCVSFEEAQHTDQHVDCLDGAITEMQKAVFIYNYERSHMSCAMRDS